MSNATMLLGILWGSIIAVARERFRWFLGMRELEIINECREATQRVTTAQSWGSAKPKLYSVRPLSTARTLCISAACFTFFVVVCDSIGRVYKEPRNAATGQQWSAGKFDCKTLQDRGT